MLVGAVGMGLALTIMGLAAYQEQTALWLLLCILGYIACFALSLGPVTWVILSEIFPLGFAAGPWPSPPSASGWPTTSSRKRSS